MEYAYQDHLSYHTIQHLTNMSEMKNLKNKSFSEPSMTFGDVLLTLTH